MKLIIKNSYEEACEWGACYLVKKMNEFRPGPDKYFILGLSAGSSVLGLYTKLVEKFEKDEITFKFVKTFNTHEYIGIPQNHPQSSHYTMWNHFFRKIDIIPSNVNIPDGNASDLQEECLRYEDKLHGYGGVDLFIAEISPDGQLGYNEPGSSLASRTRVKNLCHDTKQAKKPFFNNDIDKVPKRAITVGVANVMEAKEVILVAAGSDRAFALYKGVEESINHMIILSAFQKHAKTFVLCDKAATLELKGKTVEYFLSLDDPLHVLPTGRLCVIPHKKKDTEMEARVDWKYKVHS